ncbi:MAG: hypothetical protein QM765_12170 [Myxococcales bacterium]
MNALRLIVVLFTLLAPLPALAGSVYLNGTKVDGLTNTKIDKCAVEFDAKANVLLNCPGYAVKVEGAEAQKLPPPAKDEPAPTQITRHYFLVTEQGMVGASQYDIQLFINSKFVRTMRSEEEQIVTEVTKHLQPGKNVVTFVAKKQQAKDRKSFSPEHFYRVIVGEGAAGGDKVMIDDALITFQKTAADTADATQEFTLVAR